MSNPFPYNKTISVVTPTVGSFSGYNLIISASSNGVGASVIQPTTSSSSQLNYNYNSIANINADGASTTALAFLVNTQNQVSPPYYFLLGSEAGNLWLFSFTPTPEASDFSASCIKQFTQLDSYDTPIASIFYDCFAPEGQANLFIAGNNGNFTSCLLSFSDSNSALCRNGYALVLLPNGSLVLYSPDGKSLWSTSPPSGSATDNYQALMQTDGNFVVYNPPQTDLNQPGNSSDAVWSTQTEGNTGAYLSLSDDGTLTIQSASGSILKPLYTGTGDSSTSVILIAGQQLLSNPPQPSYKLIQANHNYSTPGNNPGQVQITPHYQSGNDTVYYLTGESSVGVLKYTASTISNPEAVVGAPANTVAVAVDYIGGNMYVATATALYVSPYGATTWTTLWQTQNQVITSIVFSPIKTSSCPNGALFIGTYSVNDSGLSGLGSIYVYEPLSNGGTSTPFALAGNTVNGSVYSLYADVNGHVLANAGSTGLTFFNLSPTSSFSTQSFQLIDNQGQAVKSGGGWGLLVSLTELYLGVITDDPQAIGFGIAGVTAVGLDDSSQPDSAPPPLTNVGMG